MGFKNLLKQHDILHFRSVLIFAQITWNKSRKENSMQHHLAFSASPSPSVSNRTKHLFESSGCLQTQIQMPFVLLCMVEPNGNPADTK